MSDLTPSVVYLNAYQPTPYIIDRCDLHVDIFADKTLVKSVLHGHLRVAAYTGSDLILHGNDLQLVYVKLNDCLLDPEDYQLIDNMLKVSISGDSFILETQVSINPQNNTHLMGLYQSKRNLYTQCEPEGFRRITYYYDRPDAMTRFSTSISADQKRYPVLLSNGNLVETKSLPDGRHWVKWVDPSLKPCYLFALVAGDFDRLDDYFITRQGRRVELVMYLDKGAKDKAYFAMASLKRSMAWDEKVYGREYDLDSYMVVTVDDFNFGAMENKGLNIFNSKCVLASKDVATDADHLMIQGVIAHEYFHNWSGNRVTCRDWFQITLKEGLTIYRDQSFTADHTSAGVARIKDVMTLREHQFPEDAGPLSHPIRPESYIEINNFYTTTVYNKGAEIIRMLPTLLGKTVFHRAMDEYFDRFDGSAVTTDDFIQVMMDISGQDLQLFKRWYGQSGTPVVTVDSDYNPVNRSLTLRMSQKTMPTADQSEKLPLVVPVRVALFTKLGQEVSFQHNGVCNKEVVLVLDQAEQEFVLTNVSEAVIPSLLRGFSAPVQLYYDYCEQDLLLLMQHDTDDFNRWEAASRYKKGLLKQHVLAQQLGDESVLIDDLTGALSALIKEVASDPYYYALLLQMPSEAQVLHHCSGTPVDVIVSVRDRLMDMVAHVLSSQWLALYHHAASQLGPYELDIASIGWRGVKDVCLQYIARLGTPESKTLAYEQYMCSDNLTDRLSALTALNGNESKERTSAFEDFYKRFKDQPLVIDRWFGLQASAPMSSTFKTVKSLIDHPDFELKNPNRTRALLGSFAMNNMRCFHDQTGEPYAFLVEQVRRLDKINPQLATRVVQPMTRYASFDAKRSAMIKDALHALKDGSSLSRDLYEVVHKSLDH